jgi:nitronate monooxygenase
MPVLSNPRFEDQVVALLDARPPVLSVIFGIPPADIFKECRKRNIKIMGTATTSDEALALEQAGVDVVVASGFEAGGHRGSFLGSVEDSLTGTFSLIPQVADRLSIPVVAAGGIADGRGIAAAMVLGAEGVQIGTAFLACAESNATDLHKQKLFSEESRYTVLTKVFSGRLARGVRNRLAQDLKEHEKDLAPFPMQKAFLAPLTAKVLANNRQEYMGFWSGQSAALIKYKTAKELFQALIEDTGKILNRG